MKKIEIITFFNNGNLGSELQAFSIKEFLNSQGYDDVFFVKRTSDFLPLKVLINLYKRVSTTLLKIFHPEIRSLLKSVKEYQNNKIHISPKTIMMINSFSKENLRVSFICNHIKNNNIHLCGSDQIWSPLITPYDGYNFFYKQRNLLSYSSSFGVNNLPKYYVKRCRKYLKRFEFIGVRELQSKQLIDMWNINNPILVLDPVFLMDRKYWISFAENLFVDKKEGYIFCYFLDRPTDDTIDKIISFVGSGKAIYFIDESIFEKYDNFYFEDIGPKEFIYFIQHCDYVITDSFHACAFSIIFNKQFTVFERNQPNSIKQSNRITSLLSLLKIENRLSHNNVITDVIEFKSINKLLDIKREESSSFLIKALQKMENRNEQH